MRASQYGSNAVRTLKRHRVRVNIGDPECSLEPISSCETFFWISTVLKVKMAHQVWPAFDLDGNATSFNNQEIDAIREIVSRVSEAYSPFNIDVTTVDTEMLTIARRCESSSGMFKGATVGGSTGIRGFSSASVSNTGYVFPNALAYGTKYIALAAIHEAGHGFGLYHQSDWSGSSMVRGIFKW